MTTDQPNWIHIDPDKVDVNETASRKGVEFHVFLSPYDLPDAVRGAFDSSLNRFVIEFRYLAQEPSKRITMDAFVTLQVGEKSGRIQRIEVDVKGLGAKQVALRMEQAIDQLRARLRNRVPTGNFSAAKRVLHQTEPQLLAGIS